MILFVAFFLRVLSGKIGIGYDIVIATYRFNDTSKVMRFVKLLTLNLNTRSVIYVANHKDVLPLLYQRCNSRHLVLDGSNKDAEWSAYQQGITLASSRGIAPGGLILINDTVTTHRSFTILRYIMLINCLRTKLNPMQMAGFCDGDRSNGFHIFEKPVGPWVSSYLFYLTPDLVLALNTNLIPQQEKIEEWYSSCDLGNFFPIFINEPFRKFLESWLFKGGWYGSQTLSEGNLDQFKRKLKSILYEANLSAEVTRIGFIYDLMPKQTLVRYANDKVESLSKRRLPKFARSLISGLLLVK